MYAVLLVATLATSYAPTDTVRPEPMPVARAILALHQPDTVTIAGRALVASGIIQRNALDIVVDDGTGALRVFSRGLKLPVKLGDSVTFTGVVRTYRGDRELVATTGSVIPAAPRIVEPTEITVSAPNFAANWGRLVTLSAAVAAVGRSEGGEWMRLRGTRMGDTSTVTLWVAANHGGGIAMEPLRDARLLSVTGFVTAFRDNPEDPIVWQIVPRDAADLMRIDRTHWYERAGWVSAILLALAAAIVFGVRLVTTRHARALQETEARYRQLLELIPDAVIVHEGGKIIFTNPAAARLLDVPTAVALVGCDIGAFLGPEARAMVHTHRATPMPSDVADHARARMLTSSGAPVDVEITASPCRYHDTPATLVLARDISRQLRVERDLESLALLDELTGLHNRRGFTLFAEQELARARRYGRAATLVFADLDGLKKINDQHGHAAGDVAIRAVARALRSTVRESDVVARWAGDEFVALLLESPETLGETFGDRLGVAIRAQASDLPFTVSATVGTCRLDSQGVNSLTDALRVADAALYARRGRRRSVK